MAMKKPGLSSIQGNEGTVTEKAHRQSLAPKYVNVELNKSEGVHKARVPTGREANKKMRMVSGVTATG